HRMYDPFRLDPASEVARFALERSERAGLRASFGIADGGLDANWMVRHGVPTVTFGAGQRGIHAVGEWVDLPDFLDACRLAVALATEG
ncbi:MAG: M20/M25/M40 family metallo-hydrolase, partial [Candidatus Rokuibacteriota bacterium]